jgi:hypothetical protein
MKLLEDFNKLVDALNPEKPLDEEGMKIFIKLMISEDEKLKEVITSDNDEIVNATGIRIFLSRLGTLTTLKITRGAALAIGVNIENPGMAVLYAYYLNRKCDPNSTVTLDDVGKVLFPWGMISDDQHKELWEAQKIITSEEEEEAKALQQYGVHDNLLDYKLTWVKEEIKV